MQIKRTHKLLKNRKLWIVFGALLLVAAPAAMWALGSAQWSQAFNQTQQRSSDVRSMAAIILSSKTTKDKRLAMIAELSRLKTDGMCQGSWLNDWQKQVIEDVNRKENECRKSEANIAGSVKAASSVTVHLAADTKISEQIARLKMDTMVKTWQETALKNAQDVQKALDGIRVVSTAEPVLKVSKERVAAIMTAWTDLNEASKSKIGLHIWPPRVHFSRATQI